MAPYCATKYAVEGLIESMLYETAAFSIRATLVEPGHVRMDDPASLVLGPPPAPTNAFHQQLHRSQHHISQPSSLPLYLATSSVSNRSTPVNPPFQSSSQVPINTTSAPALKKYGHFSVLAHASPPYSHSTSPSQHTMRIFQWFDSRQPTSVVRATELVWQLGHCAYPPLRLLLGSYAVESVRDRLKSITEEIEDWKHLHFPVVSESEDEEGQNGMAGDEDGDVGDVEEAENEEEDTLMHEGD